MILTLSLIASLGLLLCFACLVALHALPTGFQPVRDPVSNYATGRFGYLYSIQAFSSGLTGAFLLAILLLLGVQLPLLGIIALGCYAISRLLIVGFPTDVGTSRTSTGRVHVVLATLTFAGIAVASGVLTGSLTRMPQWSHASMVLQIASWLTEAAAVAIVIVFVIRPLQRVVGLVERLIYAGTLLWLGTLLSGLVFQL